MTDFLDLNIELDSDPAPTATKKRRGRPAGSGTSRKANLEKEVAQELGMYIMLGAAPFQLRDPICAGAVMQQSQDIGNALAAIVIDSPAAMRFLRAGGSAAKYLKLAMALAPVVTTVREHHFGGNSDAESNNGNEFAGYPQGAMG